MSSSLAKCPLRAQVLSSASPCPQRLPAIVWTHKCRMTEWVWTGGSQNSSCQSFRIWKPKHIKVKWLVQGHSHNRNHDLSIRTKPYSSPEQHHTSICLYKLTTFIVSCWEWEGELLIITALQHAWARAVPGKLGHTVTLHLWKETTNNDTS